MTDHDRRPALAALLGHLNQHPHLSAYTIRVDFGGIDVHAMEGTEHRLPMLADWARTLAGHARRITIAVVASDENRYTHVHLNGLLGFHRTKVVVTLDEDEADLLAAHMPLVEGTEFDVDTLFRLTATKEPAA